MGRCTRRQVLGRYIARLVRRSVPMLAGKKSSKSHLFSSFSAKYNVGMQICKPGKGGVGKAEREGRGGCRTREVGGREPRQRVNSLMSSCARTSW